MDPGKAGAAAALSGLGGVSFAGSQARTYWDVTRSGPTVTRR